MKCTKTVPEFLRASATRNNMNNTNNKNAILTPKINDRQSLVIEFE